MFKKSIAYLTTLQLERFASRKFILFSITVGCLLLSLFYCLRHQPDLVKEIIWGLFLILSIFAGGDVVEKKVVDVISAIKNKKISSR